ncbi:hypothetical protein EAE96_010576 [Botrytis aclada]|nr:hypothetical protein EAE96_010576 [Botrytis aclada]
MCSIVRLESVHDSSVIETLGTMNTSLSFHGSLSLILNCTILNSHNTRGTWCEVSEVVESEPSDTSGLIINRLQKRKRPILLLYLLRSIKKAIYSPSSPGKVFTNPGLPSPKILADLDLEHISIARREPD